MFDAAVSACNLEKAVDHNEHDEYNGKTKSYIFL